jgi:hypothetical protein
MQVTVELFLKQGSCENNTGDQKRLPIITDGLKDEQTFGIQSIRLASET